MSVLLEVKDVSKTFEKGAKALSEVSFSVEKGEFLSIIGPSGAGKSTLLRCINRMVEPSEGEVHFDGKNILTLGKKDLRKTRTKIGMIFQHYNLVNRLTVIENTLHGRLGYKSQLAGMFGHYSKEEKQQAAEIIRALGLEEQMYKRADQLSGGQKQRTGIARSLVQQPKLLLCDEPIASLDPNSSRIIMKHLRNICSEMGITVLVNLHQVEAAIKYSDRIIGINGGKVAFSGKPKELAEQDLHRIYGSEAGEMSFNLGGSYAG